MTEKLGPYLLGPNDENQGIYTGDARELARAIPDESVDLIFTDPVYQNIDDYKWTAELANRILTPKGHLVVFFQTNLSRDVANAIHHGGMNPYWILSVYIQGGPSTRMAMGFTRQKLAYFCIRKDCEMWQHELVDVIEDVCIPGKAQNHPWQKSNRAALKWIGQMTTPESIVLDCFCGSGLTMSICKVLGRRWLSFEIDTNIAGQARELVNNTPLPLFTVLPEQMEMGL